jgi:hypothetical protein
MSRIALHGALCRARPGDASDDEDLGDGGAGSVRAAPDAKLAVVGAHAVHALPEDAVDNVPAQAAEAAANGGAGSGGDPAMQAATLDTSDALRSPTAALPAAEGSGGGVVHGTDASAAPTTAGHAADDAPPVMEDAAGATTAGALESAAVLGRSVQQAETVNVDVSSAAVATDGECAGNGVEATPMETDTAAPGAAPNAGVHGQ